jgi:hypothetical protein
MKIIVCHEYYGCETGCCGHVVEVDGQRVGGFSFEHPDGAAEEEVKEYVRWLVTKECGEEHVKDIDWDDCIVQYD